MIKSRVDFIRKNMKIYTQDIQHKVRPELTGKSILRTIRLHMMNIVSIVQHQKYTHQDTNIEILM